MPFDNSEQDLRKNPYEVTSLNRTEPDAPKEVARSELTPTQKRNNKILAFLTVFFVLNGTVGAGYFYYDASARGEGNPFQVVFHSLFALVLAFFLWRARAKVKKVGGG